MQGSGGGPPAAGPSSSPVSLRAGGPRDATSAATLHATLISEGFLSSLGPRFLRRLYGRIVRSDGSFLLVAEVQGVTIGFIAGSVAIGKLYRSFILRDGVLAALSAPWRIALAWPRVMETLRHGRSQPGPAGAELLAVAVDPAWRARRVGRSLVDGFLGELELRGVTTAHVVVGADNTSAIAMYHRSGFTAMRRFEMHRGAESVLMETAVPTRCVPDAPTLP